MKLNDMIGQDRAKSKLDFFFRAVAAGEAFPTTIITGQKGNGKTEMMTATASKLKEIYKAGEKRGQLVNAGAIKNMKQFWNSIVIPVINDRDVTLCVDECHKLPKDVTTALLTMTNPNESNQNSFTYEDYTVDINLKRQTFLFATTEPHEVFHALINRCERIALEPYTLEELAKILKKHASNVKFSKGVFEAVSPTLRGNARTTVLTARKINSYAAQARKDTFHMEDWGKLSQTLDILPLGLTRDELAVLRILQSRKDTSLTRLAATLGMTPQAVRQDCELYLLSSGLMEIATGGRNITPRGQDILNSIENSTQK